MSHFTLVSCQGQPPLSHHQKAVQTSGCALIASSPQPETLVQHPGIGVAKRGGELPFGNEICNLCPGNWALPVAEPSTTPPAGGEELPCAISGRASKGLRLSRWGASPPRGACP